MVVKVNKESQANSCYQILLGVGIPVLFVIGLLLVIVNIGGALIFFISRAEYSGQTNEMLAVSGDQRLCAITEIVLYYDSFLVYYYVKELDDNVKTNDVKQEDAMNYSEVVHSQSVYGSSVDHYSPAGSVKPCWSQDFDHDLVVVWQRPGLSASARHYLTIFQYYPDFFVKTLLFFASVVLLYAVMNLRFALTRANSSLSNNNNNKSD